MDDVSRLHDPAIAWRIARSSTPLSGIGVNPQLLVFVGFVD
jgi:hypothetical protein